mmetsp:Transcript_93245/g.213131  ORF Transcript_93245/g.213131 Transcript_93245/m.213131 type:complete len:945 (+) Transcript_93245:48-2882(+)|eukprot:CAMPEP_0204373964 /NCGR_PEP_ID=MMETSP0469-20131031/48381_1 /ASSEMBLY_ACC=CAM_ASM_000384 /TAXON_ID=2969 /ORGANISM="Oxyrrhis marina" /LENGTH=944 /DNA_ID=CAMNT_0051364497 /DNA_START=20 /DNA_END=2854 /DNA_ORIENTATION=-
MEEGSQSSSRESEVLPHQVRDDGAGVGDMDERGSLESDAVPELAAVIPTSSGMAPSAAEVAKQYLRALGILPHERLLLELISAEMQRPLLSGWQQQTDTDHRVFYWNEVTGESSWSHPDHEVYMEVVQFYRSTATNPAGIRSKTLQSKIAAIAEEVSGKLERWTGPHVDEADSKGQVFYFDQIDEQSSWSNPFEQASHSMTLAIRLLCRVVDGLDKDEQMTTTVIAATHLQKLYRGRRARQAAALLREERRKHDLRMRIAAELSQAKIKRKERCAIAIQRRYREMIEARRRAQTEMVAKGAMVSESRRMAAVIIQAHFRGWKSRLTQKSKCEPRRMEGKLRVRHAAARVIQGFLRRRLITSPHRAKIEFFRSRVLLVQRAKSATKIQAVFRGFRVRRAATVIFDFLWWQQHFRRTRAARRIQSVYRSKREYADIYSRALQRQRHRATLYIQRCWRGSRGRRRHRALKTEWDLRRREEMQVVQTRRDVIRFTRERAWRKISVWWRSRKHRTFLRQTMEAEIYRRRKERKKQEHWERSKMATEDIRYDGWWRNDDPKWVGGLLRHVGIWVAMHLPTVEMEKQSMMAEDVRSFAAELSVWAEEDEQKRLRTIQGELAPRLIEMKAMWHEDALSHEMNNKVWRIQDMKSRGRLLADLMGDSWTNLVEQRAMVTEDVMANVKLWDQSIERLDTLATITGEGPMVSIALSDIHALRQALCNPIREKMVYWEQRAARLATEFDEYKLKVALERGIGQQVQYATDRGLPTAFVADPKTPIPPRSGSGRRPVEKRGKPGMQSRPGPGQAEAVQNAPGQPHKFTAPPRDAGLDIGFSTPNPEGAEELSVVDPFYPEPHRERRGSRGGLQLSSSTPALRPGALNPLRISRQLSSQDRDEPLSSEVRRPSFGSGAGGVGLSGSQGSNRSTPRPRDDYLRKLAFQHLGLADAAAVRR